MENNSNKLAVISLVINALLVVAVVVLFVRMPKAEVTTEVVVPGDSISVDISKMNEKGDRAIVVYYNSDSLNTQSKFVLDLQKEIMEAQFNAEKRLKAKEDELRRWDAAWQEKMPLLTTEQEKYVREGEKKQMELMQLQQQLEQEFFETQNRLTMAGVNRITMYTRNLALANGYDYVISYQLGGQVVFCNPKMDITAELVEMMNADYESSADTLTTNNGE